MIKYFFTQKQMSVYSINARSDWVPPSFEPSAIANNNDKDYPVSVKPIGVFPMQGDSNPDVQFENYRGAVGDHSRTLYDSPPSPGLVSERGVELYENFGCDETFREPEYLDERTDEEIKYSEDFYNYHYLKTNTIFNWGRRVSLFGSVEFSVFDFEGSAPVVFPNNISSPYDGFQVERDNSNSKNYDPLVDISPMFSKWIDTIKRGQIPMNLSTPMLSKWIMRIQFSSPSINPEQDYEYFGNSRVTCRFNGFEFEYSEKNAKTETYQYLGLTYYLSYYSSSTKTLYVDATEWFLSQFIQNGILDFNGLNYLPTTNPAEFNTVPSTDGYVNKNGTSGVYYPAPISPVTHAYDGIADRYRQSGKNPISSGFKSMYIPPHMEIQAYSQTVYDPNVDGFRWDINDKTNYSTYVAYIDGQRTFLSAGSNKWIPRISQWKLKHVTISPGKTYSTTNTKIQNGNTSNETESYYSLPLNFQHSPEQNGIFPTFGTNIPNSLQKVPLSKLDTSWIYASEYQPIYSQNDNPFGHAGGIYNGSLVGIKVSVITNSSLYNYFGPGNSIYKYFIPEIVLNPAFYQGRDYVERLKNHENETKDPYVFTDEQKITDVSKFWSDDNSFWNGESINIDTTFEPHDVIPWVKKGSTLNKPRRIKSFEPTRGIYSIEWLYILFNCCIKCQINPSYVSGGNDITKSIYTPCNPIAPPVSRVDNNIKNVGCCVECMLYADPYAVSGAVTSLSSSSSDDFMFNYAGMRNLTYYYAKYLSNGRNITNNECACIATTQFCSSELDAKCNQDNTDVSSAYYYKSQVKANSGCNNSLSTYCNSQIIQANAASNGGVNKDNKNIIISDQCGGDTPDIPDEPETEETPESNGINPLWVILIVLAVILIIIIAVFIAWKYNMRKNI